MWTRLVIAPVVGLLLIACGQGEAPPAPAAQPAAPRHVLTLEQKLALNCEAGQEHWRAQGQPVRGGTVRRAQSTGGAPHMDLFQPGNPSALSTFSRVYQRLVEPRACYYEDTAMVPDLAESW